MHQGAYKRVELLHSRLFIPDDIHIRSLLSFCGDLTSFLFLFVMHVVSEPFAPSIRTAVPGPATHGIKEELDTVIDSRTVQVVIDYDKSIGN